MKRKPIATRIPETREDWLKQRSAGIGGSDAGAVMGVNPYKSPYTVWAEKTGFWKPADKDSERMRQGRDLEDYVARRFMEETGKKVQKTNFSYQSPEHPFMLANIDRKVVGENAGLECKTASIFTGGEYSKGGVPMSYYCQCLHYMAVMGFDRMYLAALVFGEQFVVITIDRTDPGVEEDIAALIDAEAEFWALVESNTPPEIDGSESTKTTLNGAFSPDGSSVDLSDLEKDFESREAIKAQIKELKEIQETIENRCRAAMQEAEKGSSAGFKVTWKEAQRSVLNKGRLEHDHPGLLAGYMETTTSRRLTISKVKEKAK